MNNQVNYLEEAPKIGNICHYLYIRPFLFSTAFKWSGHSFEYDWLNNHRVYSSLEDAAKAAKFIKNFLITHREQLKYLTSEPEAGTKVCFAVDMIGHLYDVITMSFDPNDETNQKLLHDFRLYRTREDLENAIKLINEALVNAKEKK